MIELEATHLEHENKMQQLEAIVSYTKAIETISGKINLDRDLAKHGIEGFAEKLIEYLPNNVETLRIAENISVNREVGELPEGQEPVEWNTDELLRYTQHITHEVFNH